MMDGRGYTCRTVLISPRPFRIKLAFPSIMRVIARRVLQTLIGSKFALSTKTGACITASNSRNYSTVDKPDRNEIDVTCQVGGGAYLSIYYLTFHSRGL